ncbi:malonyl-ACP O-methyltransferase BioC [Paludibacterium yongneupense]|uniref:malonyl-ACP O-methyltransferase BioC n=1 Tax=Paludibacterium yongneupense TaxID=400061 RepID=UPI0003FEB49B|nr:malonyl-ACP O-methyltransferase BioC [Paludibacterium yongneupense]
MSEVFYTDKERVRRSFDRAAGSYDSAAVLQREVSTRMASRLDYVRHAPSLILDAGSGTGFGAAELRRRYPDARVLELDLAPGMLLESRGKQRASGGRVRRWLRPARPWQICGDIERLPLADASVDMIWSNLAIQWVNIPDAMFREFRRVLKEGGLLMFSTLGPDTLKELNASFGGLDEATHVNRFIDMHDLGDALLLAGFTEPVMDTDRIVLTYDTVRDVMRDLKALGAHNATAGRRRGLMGKEAWRRIEQNYETWRRDGVLPASYEVVYGHAWKVAGQGKGQTLPDGRQIIEFIKPK